MRQNKGFSLVELMIVVAIIGILAAIAIPNFVAMQAKSKRAEVPANVDAVKTAELAYDAGFDTYVAASENPRAAAALDKTQMSFAFTQGSGDGWDRLGWRPDGPVRGAYQVTLASTTDFRVHGMCDVDDDGTIASYSASELTNAHLITSLDNGTF